MSDETRSDTYAELAALGPYGVHPGHALITMVEPHPGHEYAYNRWYEDDHYIAGAMAMPWMYAGRRWVATRELQLLRYPEKSAVAQPVTPGATSPRTGSRTGRYDDHMKWTVGINKRLNRDGRVYQDRTHVFTAFQDHEATVYRDGAAGPGTSTPSTTRTAGWCRGDRRRSAPGSGPSCWSGCAPGICRSGSAGSPAAMVTVFRPTPLPGDRMTYVKQVEGVDTRLTLLWFLQEDPRDCWEEHFTGLDAAVAESGLGRVELVAPFIPTVPGTDRYVDQLR